MEKNMENKVETREYVAFILALYRDNGKQEGNYYTGVYRVYIRVV